MEPLNYFKNKSKIQRIDTLAYLDRIGVKKEEPSLQFLKKLHRNHLLSIPFENLDIHYHNKIVLDYQMIFDKIIKQKRGGFCYELNGLFLHLLGNLGFKVFAGSARVFKDEAYSPEFDHMLIFVRLQEETWLCDVGFGELFNYPKKIEAQTPQLDLTTYFRFEKTINADWELQKSKDNSLFEPMYLFTLQPRELIEFIPRCNYHQESTSSDFKNQKIISQQFPEGRITLTDRKLKTAFLGEVEEKEIMNEDEFLFHLKDLFGISPKELFGKHLN